MTHIWKKQLDLAQLNEINAQCAVGFLGVVFSAKGENWLEATLELSHQTTQPLGWLHGGISAFLAETVGSMAGYCASAPHQYVLGVDITATHLRAVKTGQITARAIPLKLGRTLQFWQIEIRDENDHLCCHSRLTLAVINQREEIALNK